MALSLDLSTTLSYPATQNDTATLAISTTPDTVTITVNPNYPRVIALTSDVAFTIRKDPARTGFPVAASGTMNIQIAATTTFTFAGAASGTLFLYVIR